MIKMNIEKILFTVEDMAQMLSVSSRQVMRYVEDGSLTARQHKAKGKLFFTSDDVNSFVAQLEERDNNNAE